MIDPTRIEQGVALPPEPRAAFFIGRIGSKEVVDVQSDQLPFITAPDGSIGLPAAKLGELAASLPPNSIIWIRGTNSVENGLSNGQPDQEVVKNEVSIANGGIILDLNTRHLIVGGTEVSSTRTEFELLCALARNSGMVMGRDQILTAVWGDSRYREGQTIDVHIANIRKKIGKDFRGVIQTVQGVGYMIEKNKKT